MEVSKCNSCSLLNFAGESSCKSCGGQLVLRGPRAIDAPTISEDQSEPEDPNRIFKKRIINGAAIFAIFLTLVILIVGRPSVILRLPPGHHPTARDVALHTSDFAIFNPFRDQAPERKAEAYVQLVASGEIGTKVGPNGVADRRNNDWANGGSPITDSHRPSTWALIDRLDQGTSIVLYYSVECRDETWGLGEVRLEMKDREWFPVKWTYSD